MPCIGLKNIQLAQFVSEPVPKELSTSQDEIQLACKCSNEYKVPTLAIYKQFFLQVIQVVRN